MEVCMICPKKEDDKKEIADTLLSGKAIVINMEGLDIEFAQSIVDFTSGACYTLDGDLKQISKYIFIAAPESVELAGEFADIVKDKAGNKIDMSRFTTKF
ncbi:hypothetical protein P261_00590 [Lachnospiraceae bacterium TWA4]|nr:hypothetical protein P261_00590 [Lachnospiraceae bacterium TWA4]